MHVGFHFLGHSHHRPSDHFFRIGIFLDMEYRKFSISTILPLLNLFMTGVHSLPISSQKRLETIFVQHVYISTSTQPTSLYFEVACDLLVGWTYRLLW